MHSNSHHLHVHVVYKGIAPNQEQDVIEKQKKSGQNSDLEKELEREEHELEKKEHELERANHKHHHNTHHHGDHESHESVAIPTIAINPIISNIRMTMLILLSSCIAILFSVALFQNVY